MDMNERASVDIDTETFASCPRLQPSASAALDDQLRNAARFVISPSGHADDDRLQAAFKLLRAHAPVYWVGTPGVRPFWLVSCHADVMAVERRGSPFSA